VTKTEASVVQVQGYQRKKQLAPKTWLVTTVKPHQRRKPQRAAARPAERRGVAA
jgi:hypothetical protein